MVKDEDGKDDWKGEEPVGPTTSKMIPAELYAIFATAETLLEAMVGGKGLFSRCSGCAIACLVRHPT